MSRGSKGTSRSPRIGNVIVRAVGVVAASALPAAHTSRLSMLAPVKPPIRSRTWAAPPYKCRPASMCTMRMPRSYVPRSVPTIAGPSRGALQSEHMRSLLDNPRVARRARAWARALLATSGVALGTAAAAHHSISGMYDTAHKVTFAAEIVDFQFVNPHPYLVVDADSDATRAARRYRLEMDNRHELVAIGVTADTFRPGDRVVVTGSVSRTEPASLYLWRLDRAADDLRYEQIGSRPQVSHGSAR